jgi:hypothetical protein
MNSSMIGKIQKAKMYAEEHDRVMVQDLAVRFRGDHQTYDVAFHDNRWHCGCSFFAAWGTCSHTMAMQRILGVMMPPTPQEAIANEPVATM